MMGIEDDGRTWKRLGADELEYMRELVAGGYSDSQIAHAICTRFDRKHVDRTTIYRNRKKLPPVQPVDRAWQWEKMEEYGLPWEASRMLADCWVLWLESESCERYPRPFTIRLAKWCYRVDCLCPRLDRGDLLRFAAQYNHAEMAREVLGEEQTTSALTAYLSVRPLESDSRAALYRNLADQGLIQWFLGWKDTKAELELEARLYPGDPSTQEYVERYDKVNSEIQANVQKRRKKVPESSSGNSEGSVDVAKTADFLRIDSPEES